ncbi:hypothetical protein [Cohnella sp. REN36]|uniref:hypothetical protein n=1 Tax=Cohnella sp. REN36 TaxID=2887347 RepID=UPI001D15CDAE|nr:hypothetical protein [Cohnella sp. REN36]MCC3375289.1 hypothetical protein [Cohnella sp. REN36]
MNIRVELNRNWTVTGYGDNGRIVGPIAGTVPGHVHTKPGVPRRQMPVVTCWNGE